MFYSCSFKVELLTLLKEHPRTKNLFEFSKLEEDFDVIFNFLMVYSHI